MEKRDPTLAQAATAFLSSLPPQERGAAQQEVNKFVRWYGVERTIAGLGAQEVASYAERMDGSPANVARRLEPVKSFLAYARKQGLTEANLGVHLRPKKGAAKRTGPKQRRVEKHTLTPKGYERLESQLLALQAQRVEIAEEIKRAAADKDFRENAPLDAAKDQQGMIEGRIRQLEAFLKAAEVSTGNVDTTTASLGCTVRLRQLPSGDEACFMLVSPGEASPAKGKLSVNSPIGKAVLGCRIGDEVDVAAPAGTLRYRVETIEASH